MMGCVDYRWLFPWSKGCKLCLATYLHPLQKAGATLLTPAGSTGCGTLLNFVLQLPYRPHIGAGEGGTPLSSPLVSSRWSYLQEWWVNGVWPVGPHVCHSLGGDPEDLPAQWRGTFFFFLKLYKSKLEGAGGKVWDFSHVFFQELTFFILNRFIICRSLYLFL